MSKKHKINPVKQETDYITFLEKRGKAIKQRLLLSRGLRCEICKYDNINILVGHHLIEKAIGGSDDLDNLQLLCPNCHYTIHLGDSRITDC